MLILQTYLLPRFPILCYISNSLLYVAYFLGLFSFVSLCIRCGMALGAALCNMLLIKRICYVLPNPNALVAVSTGMRTVKLCTKKILQF